MVRRPLSGACAVQELVNAEPFPFHDSGVPHISLVFREMWDTANLDPVAPGLTSKRLASLAREALIAEAELTPKPGLVDRRGSGAHHDLSLALMRQSATAIEPYFAAMASCSQGQSSTAICDRSWQRSAAMRNAPCTRPRREATPTRGQSGFLVFWSRRRPRS